MAVLVGGKRNNRDSIGTWLDSNLTLSACRLVGTVPLIYVHSTVYFVYSAYTLRSCVIAITTTTTITRVVEIYFEFVASHRAKQLRAASHVGYTGGPLTPNLVSLLDNPNLMEDSRPPHTHCPWCLLWVSVEPTPSLAFIHPSCNNWMQTTQRLRSGVRSTSIWCSFFHRMISWSWCKWQQDTHPQNWSQLYVFSLSGSDIFLFHPWLLTRRL